MIIHDKPQAVTWVAATKHTSTVAKAYLGIVLIHVILLIVLSIISIDDPHIDNVYAYLGMFISCCFLYFSAQGVIKDNAIQLRCAMLSACFISTYLVWYTIFKENKPIIEGIAVISGAFCIGYLILYKFIIDGFGWYRYNRLNIASKELLSMYYTFQVFKGMVFLDIEMVTVVWILIFAKTFISPGKVIVDCVLISLEIGWAFLGLRAVRSENLILTRVFLFLAAGMFVYVGANAYWILTDPHYRRGTSPNQYLVAMGLAIVVRFLLLFWLFRAGNNFDKGLKEHIFEAGVDEMDYWGDGTPVQQVKTDGDIVDDYRLLDEKHLIVDQGNDDGDNDNGDETSKGGSKSKSKNEKEESTSKSKNKTKKKNKKYSTDVSLVGAGASSKYSGDFSRFTPKKKMSHDRSQQSSNVPSNFQRARIDSDDFD